jgi:hypothetical protein
VKPESGVRVQNGQQRMEIPVNSRWPKVTLMSAATSAWLYDMTTATEAPRQPLAILQYGLLGCALIGLIGSLVMYASE